MMNPSGQNAVSAVLVQTVKLAFVVIGSRVAFVMLLFVNLTRQSTAHLSAVPRDVRSKPTFVQLTIEY